MIPMTPVTMAYVCQWDAHCQAYRTYRLLEDLSEHQQENCAKEVNCSDGNVESVGLLVHPRAEDGDTNEKSSLDQDKGNGLGLSAGLSKADKHGLDKDVGKPWDDEPVCCSLELDIQKAPLVQRDRIRVEDVGRVLVHGNRALRNADDLGRSPSKDANHGEHG